MFFNRCIINLRVAALFLLAGGGVILGMSFPPDVCFDDIDILFRLYRQTEKIERKLIFVLTLPAKAKAHFCNALLVDRKVCTVHSKGHSKATASKS